MKKLTILAALAALVAMSVPALAQDRGRRRRWTEKPVSLESTHPYPGTADDEVPVREPGVAEIRLHFARIEMEEGFDFLEVRDGKGEIVERYTGALKDVWTPPIQGDTALVRLVSDANVNAWGFRIDRISHRGPVEVVSDVRTLRFELPRGPALKAGASAPLRVVGLGPGGSPVELTGHPIYFNIRGPIRILAVDLPNEYKIVADRDLRVGEEAVVVAYSGRSASIMGEFRIRVIPARPLLALAFTAVPANIEAGRSVEFSVVGKPRDGRGGPQALTQAEVAIKLAGPGRVVPVPGRAATYRYEAPPSFAGARSAIVSAHLVEDPAIHGKLVLALVLPYSGLEIRCPSPEVKMGEVMTLAVVGRPRQRGGKPVVIPPGDLQVVFQGAGKLVPLGGGRFRYEAPPVSRKQEAASVTVSMKGDPTMTARLDLELVRPVFARPSTVPERADLIRITDYSTRESYNEPWKKRDLPAAGEVFRNRLQNHRFRFTVNRRTPVLQVEVDVHPESSPRELKRYRESDDGFDVTEQGRAVTGEFREQFREGRGVYVVTFYVWTAPNRCERQSIRVERAKRNR